MTNPTTPDNPKQQTTMPDNNKENHNTDGIQPVDSNLTIKRKRLVRQEATTQYVEEKVDVIVKTEVKRDNADHRSAVASTVSSRSYEKLTETGARECSIKNRAAVEVITAPEDKVPNDGEPKRKQSTSVVSTQLEANPCLSSHSSGRAGSLSIQSCISSNTPCPTYSLDSWDMSEIWQLQGQQQPGDTASLTTPGHTGTTSTMATQERGRTQQDQQWPTGTIPIPGHGRTQQGQPGPICNIETQGLRNIQQEQITPSGTITTSGHGITQQEQSCHTEVMPIIGHGRKQQGQQSSMTTPGHRIKQKEQTDSTSYMQMQGQGRMQQGQPGSTDNLATPGHRRPQEEQAESTITMPMPDNGRINQGQQGPTGIMTTPGYRRTQQTHEDCTSTMHMPGYGRMQQGHPGSTGNLSTPGQGRTQHKRRQQTSHDNPTYQTIPAEFLTQSPRLENNLRPKTKEKLKGAGVQPERDLGTPNCILLTVGLVLIAIVIIMMVSMDAIDSNQDTYTIKRNTK